MYYKFIMTTKRNTVHWWKDELNINTKKEVIGKIRYIVKNTPVNTVINENDTVFILKILKHHHEFVKKCGIGIKHLEIRLNPSWNGPTLGFWIIRTDNSEVDISWVNALKPEGSPSIKEDISNAARYEISSQIHEFHNNGACNLCELCGHIMTRGYQLNVDHIKPFEELFYDFCIENNLTYSDIKTRDLGLESQFYDRNLANKWIEYHKNKATLRLTHKLCNLKRCKK